MKLTIEQTPVTECLVERSGFDALNPDQELELSNPDVIPRTITSLRKNGAVQIVLKPAGNPEINDTKVVEMVMKHITPLQLPHETFSCSAAEGHNVVIITITIARDSSSDQHLSLEEQLEHVTRERDALKDKMVSVRQLIEKAKAESKAIYDKFSKD